MPGGMAGRRGRFAGAVDELLVEEDAAMPVTRPAAVAALAKRKTESRELADKGPGGKGGGQPAVRVREFFPETLFVQPQLITDANGCARQEVDLADSITSWRLSAFASSTGGA